MGDLARGKAVESTCSYFLIQNKNNQKIHIKTKDRHLCRSFASGEKCYRKEKVSIRQFNLANADGVDCLTLILSSVFTMRKKGA